MRRVFNLVIALVSILISFYSFVTFINLNSFQKNLADFNQQPDGQSFEKLKNFAIFDSPVFDLEQWDADINYILATAYSNRAYQIQNIGLQQSLFSRAHERYKSGLSYRPRDINSLAGDLTLLIDQGAPIEFVLDKLDEIIPLVPKDQDLRAQLSLICFKLLILEPNAQLKQRIIESLSALFRFSMDYRGITLVKRYALLYDQKQTLNTVLTGQN